MQMDRISTNNNYSNNSVDYKPENLKAEFQKVENKNKSKDSTHVDVKPETVRELEEEKVIEMIEKANEDFVAYDRRFEFSIHEKTKQITVKVFDTVTDEVIRELPPEKILDVMAGIWEIAGILVDQKI